jgi:NMD protein affecting ribosome stability and mRNA decay
MGFCDRCGREVSEDTLEEYGGLCSDCDEEEEMGGVTDDE